jgi:hypothetical protein
MKPQNAYAPPTGQVERPEDPDERRLMDENAANLAMQSGHQAFAGSAEGVGSVEFDDPGAFGVGAEVETASEGAPEA